VDFGSAQISSIDMKAVSSLRLGENMGMALRFRMAWDEVPADIYI
jgi:hypothetical protein